MFTEATSGSLSIAVPPEPRILVVACSEAIAALFKEVFPAARVGTTPVASPRLLASSVNLDHDLLVVAATDEGLDLLRHMKRLPGWSLTPVIAVLPDDAARIEAYGAGADYCISPEPDRDELAARGGALLRLAATSRDMQQSRRELTARREWVHHLAHDLRGLLSVALSNLNYLSEQAPSADPDSKEAIVDSEQELKRAVSMVNDLLDIERLEKGRLRPKRVAVDLVELVRRVVADQRSVAARRNVGVILEGCEVGRTVSIDPGLLDRVVRNLLGNSLRYAPPRTSVFVEVEERDGEVRVSVTNLGPTIPPDKRAQLFQPFVRLGPDAGQATGAGLGLAFCRLAVEAHGGHIEVSEPPGGGATFTFTIPARLALADAA